jgi:hypothetical protein
VADDGCRSSVVHHDRRAVGGAGAGGRVMAAANTTPLASGLRNGDDGLEQHKGPVGWTARAFDSTHRSSAGESGRRVISRHLTRRRFHAYRLGLSRMVELRRARNDLNRLAQIRRRRNRRACDRPEGSWSLEWTLLKGWASHGRALINAHRGRKFGRTSAPSLPQAVQTKSHSMPDSRTCSGQAYHDLHAVGARVAGIRSWVLQFGAQLCEPAHGRFGRAV